MDRHRDIYMERLTSVPLFFFMRISFFMLFSSYPYIFSFTFFSTLLIVEIPYLTKVGSPLPGAHCSGLCSGTTLPHCAKLQGLN